MMRGILKHSNPRWRDQIETSARLLHPMNHNEMKRRKVGVLHWNWGKFWRNGVAVQDCGSRAKDRRASSKRQKGSQGRDRNDQQEEKGEQEKERKKNIVKERDKPRNCDPIWENQIRGQIMRESNLIVTWMRGRWTIHNLISRTEVQKTQSVLDKNRHASDGRITNEAKEQGASWNSFVMKEKPKVEAARACFAGGVSKQEDRNVEQKVTSAYVIQASGRKEEAVQKMEWRTIPCRPKQIQLQIFN